ncbi:hypothetical protein [Azospirillum canadense]|uniref:hypothetical protein n=1 Tax=Azospirillum canadense TaxID=403962 RepID=UPI0022273D1F|nr:hypothetical protein [Azospirillum canadense]MCW2243252.1 hypothetical protein [Azospirillum canadense]
MHYYPYPFRPDPTHRKGPDKAFLLRRIEAALHTGDPIFLVVIAALLGMLLAIL